MEHILETQHEFEMAHMLAGHERGCKNLHGHTYRLVATFKGKGTEDKPDMMCDFSDLKKLFKDFDAIFDHSTAINDLSQDPFELELLTLLQKHHKKYVTMSTRWTAESMVIRLANWINDNIPQKESAVIGRMIPAFELIELKCFETPTNAAIWRKA